MCEICGRSPCDPRCPNSDGEYFIPIGKTCSICGEDIFTWEEYVEVDGKCAHVDCFTSADDALSWFDIPIEIKEL